MAAAQATTTTSTAAAGANNGQPVHGTPQKLNPLDNQQNQVQPGGLINAGVGGGIQ